MNKQRFFYLKQNGRIFGPFPAAHILKLFRSDALQLEDEISVDKVNWKNALQFFNVPEDTAQPFELQQQNNNKNNTDIPSLSVKPVLSDLENPVRRDYANMQHLYIIFAAFMVITCIAALIIPSPPAAQKTAAGASAEKTIFDMSSNGNSAKKLSDLAPSAYNNVSESEDITEDNKKDAPKADKKASAAFILTLFSNFD